MVSKSHLNSYLTESMYYAQSRLSVIKHGVSTKQRPQINRECAALNPSSDGGSGDELQGWLPVHLTDGPTDGWLKGEQKETEEQPKHPRHRRKTRSGAPYTRKGTPSLLSGGRTSPPNQYHAGSS